MSNNTALITRDGEHRTAQITVAAAGLDVIERMAAEGQDFRTIAKTLGCSGKSLQECRKRQLEVADAFERGQAALADELTHYLLRAARKGNIVAAIYLTKARLGWREGDTQESRPNIIINLPDSQTPEAYLRAIRVTEEVPA
jgi:hypothetical protein